MNFKHFLAFLVLCLSGVCSEAQGTLRYQVSLDGAHASPPTQSSRLASGSFTLEDGVFNGAVGLLAYADVSSVKLYRSLNSSELGSLVLDFGPPHFVAPNHRGGPGMQAYLVSQNISSDQAADLQSGYWWVNLTTTDFPNGELRGQITSVPEPSGVALMSAGAVGLWVLRRNAAIRPQLSGQSS